MDKRNEEYYLKAAKSVLEKHIPSDMFSFSGKADCAVCLIKEDEHWKVYETEKGSSFDEATYEIVIDAIIDMLNRLSEDDGTELRKEFYELVLVKENPEKEIA